MVFDSMRFLPESKTMTLNNQFQYFQAMPAFFLEQNRSTEAFHMILRYSFLVKDTGTNDPASLRLV